MRRGTAGILSLFMMLLVAGGGLERGADHAAPRGAGVDLPAGVTDRPEAGNPVKERVISNPVRSAPRAGAPPRDAFPDEIPGQVPGDGNPVNTAPRIPGTGIDDRAWPRAR